MSNKDKLDEDFNKFNLDIEQATKREVNRLREEINILKEKVNEMSEDLLRSSSNG